MAKFQPPKAGDFRNHVYIQSPVKTPDGAGGYTVSWVDFADPWGRMEAWKGDEPYMQDQVSTVQWWELTIRWRPGITADMQVIDKALGTVYNIRNVQDPDRRKRYSYMLLAALKQQSE